jgi:hypothetical protein
MRRYVGRHEAQMSIRRGGSIVRTVQCDRILVSLVTHLAAGRSSGFSAPGATFPSRWLRDSDRALPTGFSGLRPERRHSGGSAPDLHGIPYYRPADRCLGRPAALFYCSTSGVSVARPPFASTNFCFHLSSKPSAMARQTSSLKLLLPSAARVGARASR